VTLENLYERLSAGREQQLRVILKADVEGSLEPLVESIKRMVTEELSVRFLHQGVGDVNVSDVLLADASDAVILGFRVGCEERGAAIAKECGVDIRYYRIIYEVLEDVRSALEGLLKPERREEQLGVAEVRQVFKVSRVGSIAGCFVREGTISRAGRVRVMRGGEMIYEGTIGSLRRVKDDVREVGTGYECGIRVGGFDDMQVGDTIECFTVGMVKRTLS
jgi:translation initiation factor IF-2